MILDKKNEFPIYIGCLPYKATSKEVLAFFSQYGAIDSIDIKVRKNGKGCGFGYIHCKDSNSYNGILAGRPYQFQDRVLTVEVLLNKVEKKKKKLDLDKRRVKINSIPPHITTKTLKSYLLTFGEIEGISFNLNGKNENSQLFEARVTYKTQNCARCLVRVKLHELGRIETVTIFELKKQKQKPKVIKSQNQVSEIIHNDSSQRDRSELPSPIPESQNNMKALNKDSSLNQLQNIIFDRKKQLKRPILDKVSENHVLSNIRQRRSRRIGRGSKLSRLL